MVVTIAGLGAAVAAGLLFSAQQSEVLERARAIEGRIAELREREFLRGVEAGVYDRAQLRGFLLERFARDLPPAKMRAWEAALKAFGMFPRDQELESAFLDFLTAQVGGFYDPDTDRLFWIDSGVSSMNHYVLAHEIAHALQDQHDDLRVYFDAVADFDDRLSARQAVVEGEAQFLTDTYAGRFASEMAGGEDDTPVDMLKLGMSQMFASIGAQPYLVAVMTFPYVQGRAFVQAVHDQGGWPAVDALFKHPPLSTEQILHPEKFLDPQRRDDPRLVEASDLADELGDGWARLYANELGEMQTELFIRLAGDPVRALRASSGWDGDRYVLYEHGASGRVVLQWVSVYDSEKDAREAVDALRVVLERKYYASTPPVDVRMDAEETDVSAALEVGTPVALVRRHVDRVVYLDGLKGVNVDDPRRLAR